MFLAFSPVNVSAAPSDDDRTLRSAQNAFEYRDFAKVREILWPWVHPPRIVDPSHMATARELLGISLHIEGKVSEAKEEFARVLEADPNRRLDPFRVPPQVIEAFEEVRVSMKDVLDQIRSQRGEDPPSTPTGPVEPAAWMPWLIPFGLTQFLVLDEPVWGTVFLSVQIGGIAANVAGFWAASALVDDRGYVAAPDLDRFEGLRTLRVAGLVAFGVGVVAAGLEGHLSILARRDRAQPLLGPSGNGRSGNGLSFRF